MTEPPGSHPLRIAHLCAPAGVGGLERVVQGLSSGLVARGHDVRVIASAAPGVDLSGFLDPLVQAGVGVDVLRVGGRKVVRELREVRQILRAVSPHLLHTHGYRSDLLHGWHAAAAGIATISTLHGSSRMGGISHFFEWLQLRVLRGFDGVVAVSSPLEAELLDSGVHRSRVHRVPNAWVPPDRVASPADAAQRLGLPLQKKPDGGSSEAGASPGRGSPPAIGWVGRLIPIKGCDLFLQALARLTDLGWEACVVGDGPERERLENLSRTLGLHERVRFAGAVPVAPRYFSALDLFVLSSRSEGTPMVLLEAMGAGLPVIATDVGGVSDLVRPHSDGWLVPSEDPGALAKSLRTALQDPETAHARGMAAAEKVRDQFGVSRWIERHEALYRSALRQ